MPRKTIDPRTVKALISWLRAQPARRKYYYLDAKNCLGAQYCRAHGLIYQITSREDEKRTPLKREPFEAKLEWVSQAEKQTFGGALERAKQLAA